MKKIIPVFFAILFIFTACGKSKSTESDMEKWERELKEVYSYETPFVFSQERVSNGVEYIDGIDTLVDKAMKIIRERMQKGHSTGNWSDDVWIGGLGDKQTAFNGKGYYICRIPITTYNNNRNALLETFTLYIFNEDKLVAGKAVFSNFNNKMLDVYMNLFSIYFKTMKAMPDMEFINIHAYYLRGNINANPNLIGGINPYAEASDMLGDDNKIYEYDYYSDKVKEVNRLNKYNLNSYIVEGDIFHSLPQEMRYSYDKIMDNLIWVEYK